MTRFFSSRIHKTGLTPGSLVYAGKPQDQPAQLTIIQYDKEHYHKTEYKDIQQFSKLDHFPPVTWLNLDGVHDLEWIKTIGERFKIHSLLLEDILNTDHRPKAEEYPDQIFIILKMLSWNSKKGNVESEQVSFVLGKDYLITFQEPDGDVFNPVRQRIEKNYYQIRSMGPDYLAYALMDVVVDQYFTILENLGEKIENLQTNLFKNPDKKYPESINLLKREMLFLRRAVWPLREVFATLEREKSKLLDENTHKFWRDLYDHVIQVIDSVEVYREMLTSMQDLYLSSLSYRMNIEMRTLALVATIFIPLTLVTGIYGMNFKYMPELEWKWGYPAVLGFMVLVSMVMVWFFKRRRRNLNSAE